MTMARCFLCFVFSNFVIIYDENVTENANLCKYL